MNVSSPSSDRPPASLWFALLGAPTAWGIQLLAGWLVVDFGCRSPGTATSLSANTLRLIDGAITVIALAVALVALALGIRAWRHSHESRLSAIHASERPDFLATVALFVAASFTLGIVLSMFGPALLSGCEVIR